MKLFSIIIMCGEKKCMHQFETTSLFSDIHHCGKFQSKRLFKERAKLFHNGQVNLCSVEKRHDLIPKSPSLFLTA